MFELIVAVVALAAFIAWRVAVSKKRKEQEAARKPLDFERSFSDRDIPCYCRKPVEARDIEDEEPDDSGDEDRRSYEKHFIQRHSLDFDFGRYFRPCRILTKPEAMFYTALCEALRDENVTIFTKVRLKDLFFVLSDPADDGDQDTFKEGRKLAMGNVMAKHVDFVLCDKGTLYTKVIIELDDDSHEKPDRKARDAWVDKLMDSVGYQIVHVPAQESYCLERIRSNLKKFLAPPAHPQHPRPACSRPKRPSSTQ